MEGPAFVAGEVCGGEVLKLKHIRQTKQGYPDGNCFAACIAMITLVPRKAYEAESAG